MCSPSWLGLAKAHYNPPTAGRKLRHKKLRHKKEMQTNTKKHWISRQVGLGSGAPPVKGGDPPQVNDDMVETNHFQPGAKFFTEKLNPLKIDPKCNFGKLLNLKKKFFETACWKDLLRGARASSRSVHPHPPLFAPLQSRGGGGHSPQKP